MNIDIIANIITPIISGLIYFGLAKYIKHVAPMRKLVIGELTYKGAYWGFICFGIYLMTRPVQILLGPHPMPLVIDNIREFFMLGLFAPAVFIGLVSLAVGHESLSRKFIAVVFSTGIVLAVAFCIVNIFAIGGSKEIFRIGEYIVYDGVWFHELNPHGALMPILFIIRLINPVMFMIVAGVIALERGLTYPKESVYTNMSKKLVFQSFAVFSYGFSMLFCGFMFLFWKIPNQWWLYYVGAIAAGIFEAISLSFPLRSEPPS